MRDTKDSKTWHLDRFPLLHMPWCIEIQANVQGAQSADFDLNVVNSGPQVVENSFTAFENDHMVFRYCKSIEEFVPVQNGSKTKIRR